MTDIDLATMTTRAQQCWGVAQMRGYPIDEQLLAAIDGVKRMRLMTVGAAVGQQPPSAAELAKLTPEKMADRVKSAALDRLATREAAGIVEEWRTSASAWLAGLVQTRMSTWIPMLAKDFDAAVTTLREKSIALPAALDRLRPEQLDPDSLMMWHDALTAVSEVENILATRIQFAGMLGEISATQVYGQLTAYALSIAPLTTDPAEFEAQWKPRHEALQQAGHDQNPAARWVSWLDAERQGWATIALAEGDLAARVEAANVFANLGWAWQNGDGGQALAAKMGEVAGWHTVRGGVPA